MGGERQSVTSSSIYEVTCSQTIRHQLINSGLPGEYDTIIGLAKSCYTNQRYDTKLQTKCHTYKFYLVSWYLGSLVEEMIIYDCLQLMQFA